MASIVERRVTNALKRMGACSGARFWVAEMFNNNPNMTVEMLWNTCHEPAWLLWPITYVISPQCAYSLVHIWFDDQQLRALPEDDRTGAHHDLLISMLDPRNIEQFRPMLNTQEAIIRRLRPGVGWDAYYQWVQSEEHTRSQFTESLKHMIEGVIALNGGIPYAQTETQRTRDFLVHMEYAMYHMMRAVIQYNNEAVVQWQTQTANFIRSRVTFEEVTAGLEQKGVLK